VEHTVFRDRGREGEATAAIREVLASFDNFADVCEMRVAAKEAVQPFRQAVEKRQLDARLIIWALRELPWSRTERDEARIRRECAEILAELPAEINKMQAEKERQARKVQLVGEGLAEINTHMLELLREDEITSEEYLDSDFTRRLETAVRRGLESELTGDESTKAARKLAREIIDGELE
jgi:F0F1-type ATP synthase epsilon subunit